jgi:hypothetical protein
MTQLATYPIRLRYDSDRKTATDSVTGNDQPAIWRGNDVTFAVAAFFADAVLDLSNFVSLKLQIKDKQNPTSTALAEVEITSTIDPIITNEAWEAGTEQHGLFAFTAEQTNQDLSSAAARSFWLVLSGLTEAGKVITLGAANLRILEDNAGDVGSPPTPTPSYYTAAEVDALLSVRPPSLALTTHAALRAVVTASSAVAPYTIRECYISGIIERFIFIAGTDADDDANVLRPNDYHASTNANIWSRCG